MEEALGSRIFRKGSVYSRNHDASKARTDFEFFDKA